MKRLTFSLLSILCLGLSLGLSSCDEDQERAAYLSGEWTGDMGMYFSTGNYDYQAAYTDIRFIPYDSYSASGEGEQIDYFDRPCPIRYQSFYFRWSIDNGRISLFYPYDSQLNTVIYDYSMRDGHFYGWIDGTRFSLVKLVDYDYWNLYGDNYYGYEYYDDYYYAKSRNGQRPDTTAFHAFRRMTPQQ